MRYGYLRAQLEGVDRDFRELQRIVGVHFVPSQPETLLQIINKFVEKEGRVASLQKYWALQNDEIEALAAEIALSAEEASSLSAGLDSAADLPALEKGGGPHSLSHAEEFADKKFANVCDLIESMFDKSKCSGGEALATKGCSMSTIGEFMSCLASRLDELETTAAGLREHTSSSRATSSRKPDMTQVLESFVRSRSASEPAELPEPANDMVRKMLPSMSDHAPDQEGDAEQQESRRRREHEAKKGAIDRQRRDAIIQHWVQRQQDVRGAKTARPTIRDFYEGPEQLQRPRRQAETAR